MIYFIRAGLHGPVKIGHTAGHPEERMRSLQVSCWDQLHLLAFIPGDTTTERLLHKRFSGDRMRGEWFRWTERLEKTVSGSKSGLLTIDGTLFELPAPDRYRPPRQPRKRRQPKKRIPVLADCASELRLIDWVRWLLGLEPLYHDVLGRGPGRGFDSVPEEVIRLKWTVQP